MASPSPPRPAVAPASPEVSWGDLVAPSVPDVPEAQAQPDRALPPALGADMPAAEEIPGSQESDHLVADLNFNLAAEAARSERWQSFRPHPQRPQVASGRPVPCRDLVRFSHPNHNSQRLAQGLSQQKSRLPFKFLILQHYFQPLSEAYYQGQYYLHLS